jgi:hypothetical protein
MHSALIPCLLGALAACSGRQAVVVETSAVRACIRSTACDVKSYPRVSNCVDDLRVHPSPAFTAVLATIYRCVNLAKNCDDVEACYGAMGHCEQEYVATCQDGVAVTCDLIDKRVYRYDCGEVGSACHVDPRYTFDATCVGDPKSAEVKPIFVPDCDDELCEIRGTCNTDELNHCDGPDLRTCIDSQWVSYDCVGLGLGPCEEMQNGWARCSEPKK